MTLCVDNKAGTYMLSINNYQQVSTSSTMWFSTLSAFILAVSYCIYSQAITIQIYNLCSSTLIFINLIIIKNDSHQHINPHQHLLLTQRVHYNQQQPMHQKERQTLLLILVAGINRNKLTFTQHVHK